MKDVGGANFNPIIEEIIKKSLFTERQIEIIANISGRLPTRSTVSRGAYYRQVCQVRAKTEALIYSVILLEGIGVISPKTMDAMQRIGKEMDVIFDSDVYGTHHKEMLEVISKAIKTVMVI